jgi:zinc protease
MMRPSRLKLGRLAATLLAGLAGVFLCANAAFAVKVETVISPGGITAWLVQDKSIPLVSMEFAFRDAGASLDPKEKAGLASMVSALLDEGAGDLTSQAFQRQLENQSIQLSFNAGRDTFGGSLKTLNKYRDNAIRLTTMALSKPRFDKDAVDRIRTQMLTGLKSRSSRPGYIAGRIWSQVIYGKHVYARPVGGTQKSVAKIKVADLKGFVSKWLTRDRLIIGVVGDITAAELKPILDNIFGVLPRVGERRALKKSNIPSKGALYVIRKPVPQSVVVFGQKGIVRKDPDFYAAYLMNHILGGGSFTSRLYNEVREKRGLAYSVYTYLSPRRLAPLLAGRLATANDSVAQSIKVVRDEWRRMATEGVSKDELKNAKSFINGSFPLRFSSTNRIAGLLVTLQYYQLGIGYLEDRENLINAVSQGDIKRLAKKVMDADALTFTVVGDPKGVTPTAEAPALDL